MKLNLLCKSALFLVFAASFTFAQTGGKSRIAPPLPTKSDAKNNNKSSPAYAELLLRKTERVADLEELLVEYTEDYPKVKELRYEIKLLENEISRILAVNAADAGKLTLALGKLMLRKVDLQLEYVNLQVQYKDEHPDVKQAKRKVEIYEAAIADILQ